MTDCIEYDNDFKKHYSLYVSFFYMYILVPNKSLMGYCIYFGVKLAMCNYNICTYSWLSGVLSFNSHTWSYMYIVTELVGVITALVHFLHYRYSYRELLCPY